MCIISRFLKHKMTLYQKQYRKFHDVLIRIRVGPPLCVCPSIVKGIVNDSASLLFSFLFVCMWNGKMLWNRTKNLQRERILEVFAIKQMLYRNGLSGIFRQENIDELNLILTPLPNGANVVGCVTFIADFSCSENCIIDVFFESY